MRFSSPTETGLKDAQTLGGFDAIMVASEGETWYWWYGVSAATVGNQLAAHGTRLIDLSSYMVNGNLAFTAVELGNNNPPAVPH